MVLLCFRRTLVGLKHDTSDWSLVETLSFRRTLVGLKLGTAE